MLKKIMIVLFFCFLIFSSIAEPRILRSPRIRIDSVEIKEEGPIEVGDTFHVIVNVIKNRFLGFNGELRVYLTCAGLPQKEIGKGNIAFKFSKKTNETATIPCQIGDIDANWYQQIYNIKVVLYSKITGRIIQKDVFTIESIRLLCKIFEKDKLKISEFEPPMKWNLKPEDSGFIKAAAETGDINITVKNDGSCSFNVTVIIYLVGGTSLGGPLEGVFEERKEIGRDTKPIDTGEEHLFSVNCQLRDSDRYTREFDVRAVLYADVDGVLYEVDRSTVQTIKVEAENIIEAIKIHGPTVWLIFLAAMGTILLVAITLRVIWPLLKIKQTEVEIKKREVGKKLQKIEREEQRKKKRKLE